jgi:hypothetical protein
MRFVLKIILEMQEIVSKEDYLNVGYSASFLCVTAKAVSHSNIIKYTSYGLCFLTRFHFRVELFLHDVNIDLYTFVFLVSSTTIINNR